MERYKRYKILAKLAQVKNELILANAQQCEALQDIERLHIAKSDLIEQLKALGEYSVLYPSGSLFVCKCGEALYTARHDMYSDTPINAELLIPVEPQHKAIDCKPVICWKCGDGTGYCLQNIKKVS